MSIVERRKQIKKNNIIKVIREHKEVSRFVLKKITKYSMTTILNSVTKLLEEGLITEKESTQKNVGRTPVYLDLNGQGRYFIGIEFNAEKLKAVVMNFALDIEYSRLYKLPKYADAETVMRLLIKAIDEALDQVEHKNLIDGIGIGVPGYVDSHKGVALQYSYFKNWNNVKIKELISKRFPYDVYIDNNINAMTYHYRQEHREKSNFVIVSMQYGVRLGIVLNGEIFIGMSGNAGEIGHTKVIGGERLCSCGKIGCLDSEISYVAIEQKVSEYIEAGKLPLIKQLMAEKNDKFSMEMLRDAIHEGDLDAKALLKNITGYLGRKLSTVVSVIDIEDVIALNVCDLDNELFAYQVSETIKENSIDTLVDAINVSCEIVDSFAAAKGAAIMILEEFYGFIKE